MKDRDISDRDWNGYMKKFTKDYSIFVDELGINSIKLNKKLGFIQPYSVTKHQLIAVLTFRSPTHKTYFKKTLVEIPDNHYRIVQDCEKELSIVFDESNLKNLERILNIRKRIKLSDEERQRRYLIMRKSFKLPD